MKLCSRALLKPAEMCPMPNCQQFTKSITPLYFIAVNCLAAIMITGCAHSVSPSVSLVAVNSPATAAASPSSLQQIQALQDTPYFQSATKYCHKHEYGKALGELKQLAASRAGSGGLTAVQSAWLVGQERLCVNGATPAVAVLAIAPTTALNPLIVDDYNSCGPRSLVLVDKYLYRPVVSLHVLEAAGGTGPHGTNMTGMVRAAKAAGFNALAVQAGRTGFAKLPMPAVAWVYGDHYIAVLSMHGRGQTGTATVWDPNALVPVTLSQQSLLRMSGGIMLLLKQH